jgi:cell division protein FtsZ
MNTSFSDLPQFHARFPQVCLVGIGGAGGEIVSQIFESGVSAAQCIAVDTEQERLKHTLSHERVLVSLPGAFTALAPGDARIDERVFQACVDAMAPLLSGSDVVFMVVKAGQHARLVSAVAQISRRVGAVTVAVAIIPPLSEREVRLAASDELATLRRSCNTLVIADTNRSGQGLMHSRDPCEQDVTQAVSDLLSSLSEALTCPGATNIDPLAFRELMMHGGISHFGAAHSWSALRVEEATISALRGPMLYDELSQARGAIVLVSGDPALTVAEAERAGELIIERAGWNVPVVLGTKTDESLYGGCRVMILLTGSIYPYIPDGYRRLPLDMYEMEPNGDEEESLGLELDLDQLEDR